MNVQLTDTIKDIALTYPNSIRLFERLGIDYCCGGMRTLAEACSTINQTAEDVLNLLQSMTDEKQDKGIDWQKEKLTTLTTYIVEQHHSFTRQEISRLEKLFEKVCSVHVKKYPFLLRLHALFNILKQDLLPHMLKEEQVLFPYITKLETAIEEGSELSMPFFGSVQNPVQMMINDHETAGDLLREMQNVTHNYEVPQDACVTFQTLYTALQAFEHDLHQHIHLENNLLFPRAIILEQTIAK